MRVQSQQIQIQGLPNELYDESFCGMAYALRAAAILNKAHTMPCYDNGSLCKVSHEGLSSVKNNKFGISEYDARCYEQCQHGIFLSAIIDGVRKRVLTPEEEKYNIEKVGRVPVEENGCVLLIFPK